MERRFKTNRNQKDIPMKNQYTKEQLKELRVGQLLDLDKLVGLYHTCLGKRGNKSVPYEKIDFKGKVVKKTNKSIHVRMFRSEEYATRRNSRVVQVIYNKLHEVSRSTKSTGIEAELLAYHKH